jgi:hypothetical protein
MKRSLVALLVISAFVGIGVASCNSIICGPGTKQVQQKGGELRCEPVDAQAATVPCETDGGAVIKGGVCTTKVVCGPGTEANTLPDGTIACVGVGGVMCVCDQPEAGKICVAGSLYDFVTNTKSMKNVHYQAFEPLAFLANPNSAPLAEDTNGNGCYVFKNLTRPASGLIAIAINDPAGMTELQLTGTGARIPAAAKSYKVDVFFTKKTTVAGWTAQSGIDYDALGAYVGFFYNELAPVDETEFLNKETMPQSGVKLLVNGMEPANAKYLGANRETIDPTATSTSAVGGALTTAPVSISNFSGMGGTCGAAPCMWSTGPGSTAPKVVFISRFHKLP